MACIPKSLQNISGPAVQVCIKLREKETGRTAGQQQPLLKTCNANALRPRADTASVAITEEHSAAREMKNKQGLLKTMLRPCLTLLQTSP